MGIIDTLSAGFTTVNRRPWLIGVPVLFDLIIWLGPQVSLGGQLRRGLASFLEEMAGQATAQPGLSVEQAKEVAQQLHGAAEAMNGVNLTYLLGWQWPGLMISRLTQAPARPVLPTEVRVESVGLAVVLALAFVLLSPLGTSLYLGAMAQTIKQKALDLRSFLVGLWLHWARLVLFLGLILGVVIAGSIPFSLLVALAAAISPGIAALMMGLAWVAVLWAVLYLYFVNGAIFMGEAKVLQAIGQSFRLVRRNFWSALGLVATVYVISLGMPIVWGLVLSHPVGVLAGILGNAYVTSGLAAASLLYYWEHYPRLPVPSRVRESR